MDLGIKGKVALVTASSRGLGRATALALAREGCDLIICSRGGDSLRATLNDIRSLGVRASAVEMDVSAAAAATELVGTAIREFGRLDILVGNVAGPAGGDPFAHPLEAYQSALDKNVMSQLRLVHAAVPEMRKNKWGRICLITATGVREPLPGHSLSALRAGLWAWAKSVSHDVVDDGITINMLCPSGHKTDRVREAGIAIADPRLGHIVGPLGDPDEFGNVAAFLCSERARWLNGVALNVDRGQL